MESVKVFEYMLTLPTYPEPEPEDMPMFAQNRVHQRSSGNPYPNPVVVRTDRSHKEDKEYICICIENEFLKIELLPQLGGRGLRMSLTGSEKIGDIILYQTGKP